MLRAAIYAKDLNRLADFYAALLDLTVIDREPGEFACLAPADAVFELNVVAVPAAIAAQIVISDPPERREATPIKLSFVVSDLAATRKRARDLGGILDDAPTEWTWRGTSRCNGVDPEGNVFEVFAPLELGGER